MKTMQALLVVAIFSFGSAAVAADGDNEKKTDVHVGKISVEKDDKGKIESITFECEGKSYLIGTGGKGGSLAKDGEGETVEIKGKPLVKKNAKTKQDETWMNVNSYRVLFVGTVSVERDDKEKITAISLGSYDVKIDGTSKKMVEKAEGKEVVAEGKKSVKTVGKGEEKEEQEILTVKSFEIKGEETPK